MLPKTSKKSKLQEQLTLGKQLLEFGLLALPISGGYMLVYSIAPEFFMLFIGVLLVLFSMTLIVAGGLQIVKVVSALLALLPEDEETPAEPEHLPFAKVSDSE